MKQFILFTFVILCLTQCEKAKTTNQAVNISPFLDTIQIVDKDSYSAYKIALLKMKPTFLETYKIDSLKASIDIANNNIVYPYGYKYPNYFISHKILYKLLKERYNINSIFISRSCLVHDSTKYEYTYPRLMHEEIIKRYGDDFIEKLTIEADSTYYYKHKDSIYDLVNSYAALKYYQSDIYQKFDNKVSNQIKTDLIYPKGYKFKNEGSFSYTSADFIINSNGTISNLTVKSTFQNPENEKHKSFFEKQVRNYIKQTSWLPIKVYGLKLNTKKHFTVTHK